jgi:hypothetical protein
MRPSRPSTVIATVLGILFAIACPQSVPAAFTVLGWLLTNPVGVAALGLAFAATLVYTVATAGRGYGWGRL